MNCSLAVSSVHGIFPRQGIPEWVAVPSSRGSSQPGSNRGLPGHWKILYCLSHRVVRAKTFDFIQFFFFCTNTHQHNVFFLFVMLAAIDYHCVGLLCHKGLRSSRFFYVVFCDIDLQTRSV